MRINKPHTNILLIKIKPTEQPVVKLSLRQPFVVIALVLIAFIFVVISLWQFINLSQRH